MQYRPLCFFIFMMYVLAGCTQPSGVVYSSPAGYDLTHPAVIDLPIELDEISGISYYAKDTSVFAINDEFGWLYKIPLNRKKNIRKWRFSDRGDFEDVVLIDSIFYALQSNGSLVAFAFDDSNVVHKHEIPFPLNGNEFESVYYDNKVQLVLVCKDCDVDKKKRLTLYYYNLLTQTFNDSSSIDASAIAKMIGEKKIRFKPSATAINPVTHELYLLSAVNKLLVVADLKGNASRAYNLDPAVFKQAEGLAFTPAGDMIISNEAGGTGVANLLYFRFNKERI